jgi:hypothetical protein
MRDEGEAHIDEAVDEVSRSLTRVWPSGTLRAGVRARVEERVSGSRHLGRWYAAFAAAAAVLLVAIWSSREPFESALTNVENVAPRESRSAAAPDRREVSPVERSEPTASATAVVAEAIRRPAPAPAAPPLQVENIEVMPLAVEPVDVPFLVVEGIDVDPIVMQ